MLLRLSIVSLFDSLVHRNINLRYLSAALRKDACPHAFIFHARRRPQNYFRLARAVPDEREIDLILAKLKELRTGMVGLSVYYASFSAAAKLTKAVKEKLRVPVIWGGVYPTLAPDECLHHADFVCRGEGEEALVELVKRLSEGENVSSVENIWLNANGKIIHNPLRPPLADLNTLAFPFFDENDLHYVCADNPRWRPAPTNVYFTLASRGCYFSCSYCSEHLLRREYGSRYRYRVRQPQNIIEELKQATQDNPIKRVILEDAMFPYERAWIKDFCNRYKAQIGLPFTMRTNPRLVDKENFDLLVDAGLRFVSIGIESGSQRIRREVFSRYETNARMQEAIKILTAYRQVRLRCNFIVDNPFETAADRKEALDFLLHTRGFNLSFATLLFFPGTRITERALAEGKIDSYHLSWAGRSDALHSLYYRRTREGQLWYAVVCLLFFYHRLGFPPKGLIAAVYSNRFFNRYPYPLFLFCFVAQDIITRIYKAIFAIKHSVRLP